MITTISCIFFHSFEIKRLVLFFLWEDNIENIHQRFYSSGWVVIIEVGDITIVWNYHQSWWYISTENMMICMGFSFSIPFSRQQPSRQCKILYNIINIFRTFSFGSYKPKRMLKSTPFCFRVVICWWDKVCVRFFWLDNSSIKRWRIC